MQNMPAQPLTVCDGLIAAYQCLVNRPFSTCCPRPHPSRERGFGDFAQKAQSSKSHLLKRQEFQTANEIVENSISRVGLLVLSSFRWLAEL